MGLASSPPAHTFAMSELCLVESLLFACAANRVAELGSAGDDRLGGARSEPVPLDHGLQGSCGGGPHGDDPGLTFACLGVGAGRFLGHQDRLRRDLVIFNVLGIDPGECSRPGFRSGHRGKRHVSPDTQQYADGD